MGLSYYLQAEGFDIGGLTKNASVMMTTVLRARVTPAAYALGFLPGLFSTLLGTSLSGVGIYRRKTSQLFKELEA